MVYVINIKGKPLMPCSNVISRLLLKDGKAKIKQKGDKVWKNKKD